MGTVIAKVTLKKGENVNQALKRFKKKFISTQAIKLTREKKYFTKKSLKRREQLQKAQYGQKVRQEKFGE